MLVLRFVGMAIALGLLGPGIVKADPDDLQAVRDDVERTLPVEALTPLLESHPLVFRGGAPRQCSIPGSWLNGIVLIASTRSVGTGVLISDQGDVVTSEHVVQDARRARGEAWVAVWFKPSPGERPGRNTFLLGKVLKLDRQRDLAHVRIVDRLPPTARVVPLATAPPAVGQDVFTVGHPKTEVWSCGEGKIARIRPDHDWSYDDGITRRATAIQTQAPVNPGSSGGPLLDRAGAIVGIVVGPAAATRGVSYAVSIQHVHDLLR